MRNAGNIDFSEEALGRLWDSLHGGRPSTAIGRDNHGERVDYARPIDAAVVRESAQYLLKIAAESDDPLG